MELARNFKTAALLCTLTFSFGFAQNAFADVVSPSTSLSDTLLGVISTVNNLRNGDYNFYNPYTNTYSYYPVNSSYQIDPRTYLTDSQRIEYERWLQVEKDRIEKDRLLAEQMRDDKFISQNRYHNCRGRKLGHYKHYRD